MLNSTGGNETGRAYLQPKYPPESHTLRQQPSHIYVCLIEDTGGKLVHDYVLMMMQEVVIVSGLGIDDAFLCWVNGTEDTPLHRAALFDHVAISKVLLKAGTHLHRRDRRGASPLHIAASTGLPEIIEDFLEAGAALEALTVRGHSPLHMAVLKNSVHVSSLLLNTGASTEHLGAIHG